MSDRKTRYSKYIGETFRDDERLCVLKDIEVIRPESGTNSLSIYKMWYPEEDTYKDMLFTEFKSLDGPYGAYRLFKGEGEEKTTPIITKMTIWQAFMAVYPKVNCPEGVYLQIMQEVTNELLDIDCE